MFYASKSLLYFRDLTCCQTFFLINLRCIVFILLLPPPSNYSYGIRHWLLHVWPFVFYLTKIFIGVFSSHWFSHLPFLTITQSNFSIPTSHGYHMYSFKQFFWKHIKWLYDFILECLHHHIFSNILSNGTSLVN